MSEQEIKPFAQIAYEGYIFVVTSVTLTTDETTRLPATLQVEALSVIEVEKREAEYAALLKAAVSGVEPEP